MNEIIEFLIDIKELLNDIKMLLESQKTKQKKEKSVLEAKETVETVFRGYTENGTLLKALLDFAESRNKAKSAITVRAAYLLLKKLDELGKTEAEKIALVEQSTMNGWKSIYPLRMTTSGTNGVVKQTSFNSYQQREVDYDSLDQKILQERMRGTGV